MSQRNSDNTPNTARNLGTLNGVRRVSDSLGASDGIDFYRFSLSDRSSFEISVSQNSLPINVIIAQSPRDIFVRYRQSPGRRGATVTQELDAGRYFIRVSGGRRGTRYLLRLAASTAAPPPPVPTPTPTAGSPSPTPTPGSPSPSPTPSDDLPPGRDIGVLQGSYTNSDVVGADDDRDHYKFRLNEISTFTAQLSGLSQSVSLNLFYDRNSDGIFEDGEAFVSAFGSDTADALITDTLPVGDYVVRVDNGFNSTNTNYNLTLTQSPNPGNLTSDPGNTSSAALNLGTLSGARVLTDLVGELDEVDYYTFTLDQISNVSAQIRGLSQSVNLQLFYDSNNNGVFEESRFASEIGSASSEIFFGDVLPTGRYLVLVDNTQIGRTNTRYELTLNQTPNPGNLATDPGGTPGTAFALGTITSNRNIVDLVGELDDLDFYSFSFSQTTNATFQLTGLAFNTEMELFYDSDNNGIFTSTERVARDFDSPVALFSDTWVAGNYLLTIDAPSIIGGSANTKYELNIVLS